MKTRVERKYIEASIIGDSHAMSVWKHLAPDVVFRHTMTAPAKHFDGKFFDFQKDHLHISANHIRKAFPRADDSVIEVMSKARERLDSQLQTVINAQLPIISTLGSASYRFARRVSATDPNGEQLMSNRMIDAAAQDYIENFVSFHQYLLNYVPSITFVLGACRYEDNQKVSWLAYDKAIVKRMAALGVETIDVRQDMGDTELKLLPEFAAPDALHGNEHWCQAVSDKIFEIVGHPSINAPVYESSK